MQPNFIEGKPFPIPPEKVRDLKEDIAKLMAGTYEIPPEHTFLNLCAHMHAFKTRLVNEWDAESVPSEKLLDEFTRLNDALKPEKNALLAIFTSQIWNEPEFVEDRARLLRYNAAIAQKLSALGALFSEACVRWIESEEARSPLYASMIARFKEIYGFTNSTRPHTIPDRVITEVVMSGMSTAEIAAMNLADIVISHCEDLEEKGEVVDRDEALRAIQRAYRNIGIMLARMNQNVSVPLMDELWSDPSYFELREEGGEYVLYLIPTDRLKEMKTEEGELVWETMRYGDTTACPAMYGAGEHGPVITEFFQTAVELIGSSNDFPQK
ncbi:hypothetical protein K2Y00_01535 [Patescibacteria group bacterium]|nr:hypothetical protein [Patescibacteria group bacterium]